MDPANCLSEAEANVTDVDCSDAPVSGFFSPSDPNRFQKSVFGCSQQGQVQIRIEVPEGKVFNSPLTMDLASKIAELPKRDEALVDLLEPLIEEHLVQPRLEKLRAEWSEKAPAKVQQAADAANRWLEGIPKDLPGLDRSLTEGFEAVSELLDKAATVEIVAPEGRWWLYFEGKREVGDSIISQLSLQKSEGGLLGALNIVLKELESVTERAKGALGQLTSTMESLRKQFDSQKKQLAKLLSPIEAIPLELGFFCRHFPLILLIAGVIFIVWPGERLRIVMLTRSMMREAGQDDSLWHWLQHRRERGLRPGVVVAANYFVGFAVTALAVFAAVCLSTLSGSGPEVWYELGIGTGLIALAMLWRFLAVDRDIRYF